MLWVLKDKGVQFACIFSKLFCKSVFPASVASRKPEKSDLVAFVYSERSSCFVLLLFELHIPLFLRGQACHNWEPLALLHVAWISKSSVWHKETYAKARISAFISWTPVPELSHQASQPTQFSFWPQHSTQAYPKVWSLMGAQQESMWAGFTQPPTAKSQIWRVVLHTLA